MWATWVPEAGEGGSFACGDKILGHFWEEHLEQELKIWRWPFLLIVLFAITVTNYWQSISLGEVSACTGLFCVLQTIAATQQVGCQCSLILFILLAQHSFPHKLISWLAVNNLWSTPSQGPERAQIISISCCSSILCCMHQIIPVHSSSSGKQLDMLLFLSGSLSVLGVILWCQVARVMSSETIMMSFHPPETLHNQD